MLLALDPLRSVFRVSHDAPAMGGWGQDVTATEFVGGGQVSNTGNGMPNLRNCVRDMDRGIIKVSEKPSPSETPST